MCFRVSEGGGPAKLSIEDLGGFSSVSVITMNIICKVRQAILFFQKNYESEGSNIFFLYISKNWPLYTRHLKCHKTQNNNYENTLVSA